MKTGKKNLNVFFCLLIILMIYHHFALAEPFAVKRVGNLIPFTDNVFDVIAPEQGELTITVHDDISVYRVLKQEVVEGEQSIHWDGCGFNHEKLASKNYTITAQLQAESGEIYRISFLTPVEYTGQCLQYLLPSSGIVSLAATEEWFVEFRTVQKGRVYFEFQNEEGSVFTYAANTSGGRLNRLTYDTLIGKNTLSAGNYHVLAYEASRSEESYSFDLTVTEKAPEKKPVFLTGEILPAPEMGDEAIWQMMQQPAVVIDIDFFKHQKVYAGKDADSPSLGTLHGQTQALKVMTMEDGWAYIGAWNHETADYVEGWVPLSVLKVEEPNPDYGILIDKREQTLTVFYRGKRLDTLQVSTGRADKKRPEQETAAGSFLTGYHRVDFSTNGKKYDYVIQYDGGNLLHQIPYQWGKNKKDFSLGRGTLGAKASHACVRIQAEPGEHGINAYWIWTHIPYHSRVLILDDPDERASGQFRPLSIPDDTDIRQNQTILPMKTVGAYAADTIAYTVYETDGHRIGIVSCREEEYLKKPSVLEDRIKALQAQEHCEKVILRCYWNDKNLQHHTAIQEAMARKGAAAGADLVVGYGNQTVLGCERYGESLILYGFGETRKNQQGENQLLQDQTDILFDFQKEGQTPRICICIPDRGTNYEQAIQQLTADSVGKGIQEVVYLISGQS